MVTFALLFAGCEKESPTGIAFSHAEHLGRGFGCGLCHQAFAYGDPRRPPEKVCGYCHDLGDRAEPTFRCADCHTRLDFSSGGLPRPTYADTKFGHEPHIVAGVGCRDCHVGQDRADIYADIVFPPMKTCTNCHAAVGAENGCETCHEVQRASLAPESHNETWLARHGAASVPEFERNCDYCHSQKDFCQDCHMAEPPKSHTLFFRNRGHGFYVENDRMSCEPCHQQDFCLSCHDTEEGVRPASHVAAFGGRRPYLHCASCHFPAGEANGCNTCHQAGAIAEAHFEALEERDVPNVPDSVFETSRSCLDGCHPFSRVPINHPAATLTNTECLICHRR